MEQNLPAFLRTDAKTVKVCFINDKFKDEDNREMTLLGKDFSLSPRAYIYITDLVLKVDDLVVVYAVGVPKVALVMEVDAEVDIQPNDKTAYKWVVCKVDFTAYLENLKKNSTIQRTVSQAYKKNTRKQFASLLLAELPEESRNELLTLIGQGE
jgi:hypothetical protein